MKDQSPTTPSAQFLKTDVGKTKSNSIEVPSITLPTGGGAIRGIDEKFSVSSVNGTASFSVPLPFSPARGASPAMSLTYNSGAGNGVFGLGWNIGMGSIKRKTSKGLPRYLDAIESDTFIYSEAEDLVPEFRKELDGSFSLDAEGEYIIKENDSPDGLFTIKFYRPRIEGLFGRIERWTEKTTELVKWRVITKDNVTTLFGWTSNAVIADINDPKKIFEWLPEFVFDDKGNCSHYIYKQENDAGFDASLLHHRNRFINGSLTYTNLYLQKVLYGNKTPYKAFSDPFLPETEYMFQTVFDYGEYDLNAPYAEIKDWEFRPDAFSTYKSGFEVRTTRLCHRVLLFHYFTELPGGFALVKSADIEYDTGAEPDFTFLKSVTSVGYVKQTDGTYTSKKFPAIEFEYQKLSWNEEVKSITQENLVHDPSALLEPDYQFTDLFNEGLAGILTEQAHGWYYKHNLGSGNFERAKLVSPKPSFLGLGAQLQLADLDADGGKQLVNLKGEPKGFFELDDDNNWKTFKTFQNLPTIDFRDANSRMIDLNGDGKPDVLITEDNVFTWYASEGRNGYSRALKTIKSFDEEAGPHIVFSDPLQTVFLADMSGDGMTDIVRIRNGEVCYWPNLGYGRFGAKVSMANAPLFDFSHDFNPAFIRLADIDGSGTTDIIYLGKNKFTCWRNLSGNSFHTIPFEIDSFPDVHTQANVTVTDLLGNGVACIVWSSKLLKDAHAPLRYIDLMDSKKPHVMVFYKNNMGKEVTLEYTPSTHFYIEDKLAGKPWITKLHFPIHCISRTETNDRVTGWRFVSSYKYHHGYYDHPECEFRGFGMVEQTDAEHFEHWAKGDATNIVDKELHQQPIVSKTWTHTGAFLGQDKILTQFASEYWYEEMNRQGFPVIHTEVELPDARIIGGAGIPTTVIDHLSGDEWREALRACKSMKLRSEMFSSDAPLTNATPDEIKKQLTPYLVSTHNCVIELIQPKGKNKYAVFVVNESEAITYSYERNTEDPRIGHHLNIRLDEYGNVLESASVVYPRVMADASLPLETQQQQSKTVITYSENHFTNDVSGDHVHRLRLQSEVKTFELKGVVKPGIYYSVNDFTDILTDVQSSTAQYHELDKPLEPGKAQRRLFEHIRSTYFLNDLTGPLPLHQLESLALPFESYQLAYTPALVNDIYGTKVDDALLIEGKFVHSEGDLDWWVRSGSIQFMEGPETALDAANRFYTPLSYTDPYGAKMKVKYYSTYFLFVEETEDNLGNRVKVDQFNFRTLSPQRMRDINNNFSEAIADELGLIKASAVFGKGDEADDLTALTQHTTSAEQTSIDIFFTTLLSTDLIIQGKSLLQHATTRFVYDFDVYKNTGKPVVAASIRREQHFKKNIDSDIQLSFEYSNGFGKVIMTKAQAEPGLAKKVDVNPDDTYSLTEQDTAALVPKQLRWIGNGRTVLNNKGNPVKQYEPYFSVTHHYEDMKELVESGVTPIMYYDAIGRAIKTEMPDATFSKVEFDSWKESIYDGNDTILDSSWFINRTNHLIDAELLAEGKDPAKEKVAADRAAKHANTPHTLHFDSLGQPILSVQHTKNMLTDADELYRTKTQRDIEGNLRIVTDARELPENANQGNTVMQYKYDMLGNKVYQNSMDKGQQWLLNNLMGKPLRTWDERNHQFQYFYDSSHRPTFGKVLGGDGPTALDHIFDRIIYGESFLLPDRSNEADVQAINILGKSIRHFDTAGEVRTPAFDFKGQPLSTTRKLFKGYKSVANWVDANLVTDLENDAFTFITEKDALDRITQQTAPDGSIITPSYNETGLFNGESVAHNNPATTTTYIKDIDYNEKGQRNKVIHGNDVSTRFYYDKETFRLKRLETKRKNNDALQDWYYTFDPVGNVTHIEDKNIPVAFFDNTKVTGVSEYTYDALYRLSLATGRENDSALTYDEKDNWNDVFFMHQLNPGDPMSVRNYTQRYTYDEVGNIGQLQHQSAGNNWTRDYNYEKLNNRLASTQIGAETYNYGYHAQQGFMTVMPHLEDVGWNFKEEVVKTIKQKVSPGNGTAETTYYQYDGQGQRIRKITENFAASGATTTKKEERIYYSGYETYRTYQANSINFERETLSLIDQGNRFVMVETVRQNTGSAPDPSDAVGARLVRYQLNNQLGSAALELDINAQVISYEEYHPFGTTAYQAKSAAIKAAAKRYRYTSMERDEETGLEYHSARYYVAWLGRWLNADPTGIADGVNLYAYCKNNPLKHTDDSGTQADDPQLGFYQCTVFQTEVTATYSSRGISPSLRETYTGLYRIWTGDYTSEVDVGHMGRPFVFLQAGQRSPVGPQLASENRSDGGGAVRAQAATVRAAGGFAREDGIDTSPTGVASKGTRYPSIPLPAPLRDPRLPVIGRAAGPPVQTPAITVSGTTPPVFSAPTSTGPAQLSFPFAEDDQQISFNFSRPSSSGSSSSSSSTSSPVSNAPRQSSQTSFDFDSPTPVATPRSSGGGGGGRSTPITLGPTSTAGLGALGRSTPVVGEAVALTEGALLTGAYYSTNAALTSTLMTAAEATPVIAGVGVVGAGTGHVARYVASEAGASQSTADGVGFVAAVGVGAALGSVVPGVGTAVGAVAGGLVAGGLYLYSIW